MGSAFVKTIKVDAEKCNMLKSYSLPINDGVKVRAAKASEINDIARVLSNTLLNKLSYMFNEKNEQHLDEMITSCFEQNQWMLNNTLVAIQNDRIEGVCCLKFSDDKKKRWEHKKEDDFKCKAFTFKSLMRTFFSFGMNEYLSKMKDRECFIENISVDKECKNENMEEILLQAADDECANRKCEKITSLVLLKNSERRRLYENYGYSASKMHLARPIFMFGDQGCYRMEKQLLF